MLQLKGLEKTLGNFHAYFELDLKKGESVALVGESGSGKSTLLNLIAGFLGADRGEIYWDGNLLNNLPPHRRPVTTLFQDNNLFAHLDLATNLALGLNPAGSLSAKQKNAVAEMLENVGLGGFEQRLPPSLSGGQQQRVALARCLLRTQPLLLFDEPFSALDDETRQQVMALTKTSVAEKQLTLLLVTHNRDDAEALGAGVVNCANGHLDV